MRRPQIAIIGSAASGDVVMDTARRLGTSIVDQGWRIVCGGLAGVMHAAAEGAHQSPAATGGDVIGVLPTLNPDTANPFIDIVIPTGMQYARNALVVGSADVVVALGGGAGTLSEIALAWQLRKPIVALSCTEGWAAELAGRRLDHRRPDVLHEARDVESAIELVRMLLVEKREASIGF